MGFSRFFVLFYISYSCFNAITALTPTVFKSTTYKLEIGSEVRLQLIRPNGEETLHSVVTSSIYKTDGPYTRCAHALGEENICLQWADFTVNVTRVRNNVVKVELKQPTVDEGYTRLMVDFGTAQWYEAAQRWRQEWPIQNRILAETPFLPGYDIQSVSEAYWLNSEGSYLYVPPEVPLFIDYNTNENHTIGFTSRDASPYKLPRNNETLMEIFMYIGTDPVSAHMDAISNTFMSGLPKEHPEQAMFQYPIYSSWVRYKNNINQEILQGFAKEIIDNGYPMGQFEIDDRWETCYGAAEFDPARFPNITELTDYVHSNGGHATAWMYPFLNTGCDPAYTTALNEGRFVKNEAGEYKVNWWVGEGSAVDLSNETTAAWYVERLEKLRDSAGLDSFKFDAGEVIYLPDDAILNMTNEMNPHSFVRKYLEAVNFFKGFMEVRVGRHSQDFPFFFRMLDKDSRWNVNNGLQSIIPTLFAFNLAGYSFVLPDMIGGNAYGEEVSKELFIRWLQATTFMPSLQFSVVPWDYDSETVEISKKYVDLHDQYIDVLMRAVQEFMDNGTPINAPIWWLAPTDPNALACNDEYLLGNSILVAPVLEEGAISRDIYLPAGLWANEALQFFTGPVWLRDYPAPLSELPYFKRI